MSNLSNIPTEFLIAELKRRRNKIDAVLPLTIPSIIEHAVCAHFRLTSDEIHMQSNSRRIAQPRHIAIVLMIEQGLSETETESHFNKSHGTAAYAQQVLKARIQHCDQFAMTMQALRDQVAAALQTP